MLPKSVVKKLAIGVVVFLGGMGAKKILDQAGKTYALGPGMTLEITQEMADEGTNALWIAVKKLEDLINSQ